MDSCVSWLQKEATVFSIGSMNSEGMLSDNPKSGIHETTVTRTIDANGSNPAGYQGGDLIVIKTNEVEVESLELYQRVQE